MLNTVLRPTISALRYTCFNSAGVFQFALRTTAYQDSRLAFASGCCCQNCSSAPRLMIRMANHVLIMRTSCQAVLAIMKILGTRLRVVLKLGADGMLSFVSGARAQGCAMERFWLR